MSFDRIFDLTAGVYFYFYNIIYLYFILHEHEQGMSGRHSLCSPLLATTDGQLYTI